MKKTMKHTAALLTALATAAPALFSCAEKDGTTDGPVPEKSYPVTVTAGMEAESRAVLGPDDLYYWEPGDRIALFAAPAGAGSAVANNVEMTGSIPTDVLNATFSGGFTQGQIDAMSPAAVYDYYSYFPWQESAGTFPVVQFDIPSSITLTPNRFSATYAPMVAVPLTNAAPITYLENGQQVNSAPIHFQYKHVLSYAALSMSLNLASKPITRIVVTNTSGTNLSGTLNVDLRDGSCTWASGQATLTIEIPTGLNVGDVLYLPMVPGNTAGQTFTFKFYTAGNSEYTASEITRAGRQFVRGAIHELGVKVPFHVDFSGISSLSTTMYGYTYYYNGNGSNYVWLKNDGDNDRNVIHLGLNASLSTDNNGRLRFPSLDLTNTEGLTDIPIKFTVDANGGNAPQNDTAYPNSALDSRIGTVSSSATNLGTVYYLHLPDNSRGIVSSGELILKPGEPCVMIRSNFVALSLRDYDIYEAWIEAAY